MTIKGVDNDMFYIIFPYAVDKDVMRLYNTVDHESSQTGIILIRYSYISIYTILNH